MSDPIAFDPPEPQELSDLLSGYDVSSLIATGGMGAVYAANQISLDRPVAIKLLPRELGDESFREQFQAEARSMAKLNHPNLIGIYDFGQADGMPYIVMELVEGKSLYYSCYKTAIEQRTACELIIEICEGLAHAHKAGIIHRDIKPANILLDPEAHAKIGDFGLASHSDSVGGEHIAFGTPGYAAPEILENPTAIGVPSDIFAVGVILYELLTGFIPEQPPRPASSISGSDQRLDTIIRTATRRNPRMRFQNAQDMADELRNLLPRLRKTSRSGRGSGGNTKLKLGATPKASSPKLTRK
ncbi:MAG: serine/threonine protein kinase, partial [Akkermansiaceae bacterium]|nr:serine/threonine protein kinase [Akkermansiaceae bacterium]